MPICPVPAGSLSTEPRSPGPPVGRPSRWRLPQLDRRELVAVFVGGAVGTVLRAGLAQVLPAGASSWPWATFMVNVVAAFGLGYFATRLQERLPPSTYRRPLLGTGLCGGLSTFSTMQVELVIMLDAHAYLLAAGYAVASIVAGYAAVHVASAIVRRSWIVARAGGSVR